MTRAYSYVRLSKKHGVAGEVGLGLDAQRHAITHAAARLGLAIVTTFCDDGVSGAVSLEHRPGLLDAIAALKKGDVLIVAKRDRIARDTLVALLVERAVKAKKARIVSAAGEGSDDDSPTAQLLRSVLDAVAQFEREMISARTRAALQAKRARGERTGTIRYGLRQGVGATLEPDPIEQRVLALVRSYRSQGAGRPTVARVLNEAGYTTRAGSAWTPNYIASLEKTQATA